MSTPAHGEHQRFVFIDALRGVAAFAVVFFHTLHISTPLLPALLRLIPHFVEVASKLGASGVQIFFVLSGFVIAHSLRDNPMTGKAVGNFILRRQLRLDPLYWFVLLITLGLHQLQTLVPALHGKPMPSIGHVVLNFLYLHVIFGAEDISTVGWTLCIEIQFYLVFISLLFLGKRLSKAGSGGVTPAAMALTGALGVLSMGVGHFPILQAWFIHYWYYFAAGALCYWAVNNTLSPWIFGGYTGLLLLTAAAALRVHGLDRSSSSLGILTGTVTTLAIYFAGRQGHLTHWGNIRPLQYLGRISYSLYLVHVIVLISVMGIGHKLTGENELRAGGWLALACCLTVIAAHVLHVAVERPSMRLASRLRYKPVQAASPVQPPACIEEVEESESGFAAEDDEADPERG